MEDLQTKMGYLRGLMEGLGISEETKEGKVINQVVMTLNEIVDYIQDLRDDYEELFSYLEAVDEDLTELEETVENNEVNRNVDAHNFGAYNGTNDVSYDDEYEIGFAVECPECREEVTIDEDILEDEEALEVLCPNCGRVVFINDEDWEEELDALENEGEIDDEFEDGENEKG